MSELSPVLGDVVSEVSVFSTVSISGTVVSGLIVSGVLVSGSLASGRLVSGSLVSGVLSAGTFALTVTVNKGGTNVSVADVALITYVPDFEIFIVTLPFSSVLYSVASPFKVIVAFFTGTVIGL